MTIHSNRGYRNLFTVTVSTLIVGLFVVVPGEALAKKPRGGSGSAPADSSASSLDSGVDDAVPASSAREDACMIAYKNAQEREQSAHLAEARELFQTCAKPTCGTFLRQECSTRHAQIGAEMPSIVPMVTDESGEPRVDVQVKMDGELLTAHLDGRALPVDPGIHEFSFATDRGVFSTQKVLIAQGQRNRAISASLQKAGGHARKKVPAMVASASDPAADAPAAVVSTPKAEGEETATADQQGGFHAPVLSYVLGGAGLASLGVGALLIQWGRKDNSMLSQCTPFCPQSSTDHIRNLYLAADISIGVGIAALGASYLVYAITHSAKEEKATQEAYLFDVQPTRSGAVATVSGSF
jgi:hypothetical protein